MKESKKKHLPITQKHGAGCAVACVAYILNISYDAALKLFSKPKQAIDHGFFCSEIVNALQKKGSTYTYGKALPTKKRLLKVPFTIVFIARSKKYPIGHFLVSTEDGLWMNPWINFPCIASAESDFQKRLPGKAQWIIYPTQ
jgi:hypothetical protein